MTAAEPAQPPTPEPTAIARAYVRLNPTRWTRDGRTIEAFCLLEKHTAQDAIEWVPGKWHWGLVSVDGMTVWSDTRATHKAIAYWGDYITRDTDTGLFAVVTAGDWAAGVEAGTIVKADIR
jgi:hypothetical protein